MARFHIRDLQPADRARFTEFERSNREPFERFNEPHTHRYYSETGIAEAFDKLMERQHNERFLTRVITPADHTQWVGKSNLTVHQLDDSGFAMLVYQTDSEHCRLGAASALVADLIQKAKAMGLPRAEALVTSDNLVSLHLLRRAGFRAAGWDAPAALRRGEINCLRLSRPLERVVGPILAGAHMHLPA